MEFKYRYSEEKNANLLKERGVGFEEIIYEINHGNLIGITNHHDEIKYPAQKIMHVMCLDKVYCVPYVIENDGTIFLKTLYPSRKATKKYLKT